MSETILRRKLVLSRETMRKLSANELDGVVGGSTSIVCPTHTLSCVACPTHFPDTHCFDIPCAPSLKFGG